MKRLISALFLFFLIIFPLNAHALEGDWEIGALPAAYIQPKRDIYGGGAEVFARYAVIDGLSISWGAAIYGARAQTLHDSLALFTLRAGAVYALDIIQWVPAVGVHVSALFSPDKHWKWHQGGRGLGLDLDLHLQYRGIKHLGIGTFFSYHIVFREHDYMTAGLSFSWFSGMF